MYYEINVCKINKKGEYMHYFATAKRSLTFYKEVISMLEHFQTLFPEPEYKIYIFEFPEQSICYNPIDFLNKFKT